MATGPLPAAHAPSALAAILRTRGLYEDIHVGALIPPPLTLNSAQDRPHRWAGMRPNPCVGPLRAV